jgi:lysophospholipase L1-like esterase
MAKADPSGEWAWYDGRSLTVEGQGWADTEQPYDRLPVKAKGLVRDAVWTLSKHSAGICIRFTTNADQIDARWTVTSDSLAMPHMPATGVSGLDLYVHDGGHWRWIGNGRPDKGRAQQALLAKGIPEGVHEFLIYLPLYNGTESIEIGIPPKSRISKAPARVKPLCFYGTSIVHGGCAARPGMAYPAILGRRLERPIVNLGFSGNGTMDAEIGSLLGELDAGAYIIDCAPNMSPEMITERAEPLVTALRKVRPDTPIILVECISYQAGAFLPAARDGSVTKNQALRAAYDALAAKGIAKLYYVPGPALLGDDGEATVDGTHPTDLGFQRMADCLEPVLRKALGLP